MLLAVESEEHVTQHLDFQVTRQKGCVLPLSSVDSKTASHDGGHLLSESRLRSCTFEPRALSEAPHCVGRRKVATLPLRGIDDLSFPSCPVLSFIGNDAEKAVAKEADFEVEDLSLRSWRGDPAELLEPVSRGSHTKPDVTGALGRVVPLSRTAQGEHCLDLRDSGYDWKANLESEVFLRPRVRAP